MCLCVLLFLSAVGSFVSCYFMMFLFSFSFGCNFFKIVKHFVAFHLEKCYINKFFLTFILTINGILSHSVRS